MFYFKRTRFLENKLVQLSLCFSLCFSSANAFAAGDLDKSFGTNGVAKFTLPNTGSGIMDFVMLPDDRMIVGGTGFNYLNTLAFARFNKQGNLDLTFGNGNGYVNYSSPTVPTAIMEGFSVDTDYNIYAVGHGASVSNDAHIYKLDSTGAIDSSFANSGIYLHSTHPRLPSGVDTTFKAVAVQPDNKVVIVGESESLTTGAFVLRLLPDGTPDTSFGPLADGLVFFGQLPITSSTILTTNPESVKIADTGEIVVGGFLNNAGWGSFVARFTDNGYLDTAFNGTGVYLLQPQGWGVDWAGFIELDRLGNTYLLSRAGGQFNRCVVTKFNINGQIDTNYGTNGYTVLNPPAGDFYNCGSIASASHGGMAVAVMDRYPTAPTSTYNGPAKILRLDSHGQLVSSFGNQGVAMVWNPHIVNSTYSAGLFNHTFVEPQSNGNLVFAIGEYQMTGVGYTIGRLEDDGNSFSPVPSAFSPRGMQPLYTWVGANIIQIQNLNNNVAIRVEIENGEYSINGLPYTSAPGWVFNNDLMNVRNYLDQGPGVVETTTLRLGGDMDRKNAGMIRGERIEMEFLSSTGPIALDSVDPDLEPVGPGPLEP